MLLRNNKHLISLGLLLKSFNHRHFFHRLLLLPHLHFWVLPWWMVLALTISVLVLQLLLLFLIQLLLIIIKDYSTCKTQFSHFSLSSNLLLPNSHFPIRPFWVQNPHLKFHQMIHIWKWVSWMNLAWPMGMLTTPILLDSPIWSPPIEPRRGPPITIRRAGPTEWVRVQPTQIRVIWGQSMEITSFCRVLLMGSYITQVRHRRIFTVKRDRKMFQPEVKVWWNHGYVLQISNLLQSIIRQNKMRTKQWWCLS